MIAGLKRFVPQGLKERAKRLMKKWALGSSDCAISFSSNGQDLMLSYLFFYKGTGRYVDVGAHHPSRGSNSYLLYLKGWRGINIDPLPDCMKEFQRIRPRDVNLEIGIAEQEGTATYFVMPGAGDMNTFSLEFLDKMHVGKEVAKPTEVSTRPLHAIFDEHLPPSETIDVLMIDVEGYELEVLRSNDWEKYRPIVIMAEHHDELSVEIHQTEIVRYLSEHQYRLIAKTPSELFFLDNSYELHPTGVIAKFLAAN